MLDDRYLLKTNPSVTLDLGSIAKGFGVDQITELIKAQGFKNSTCHSIAQAEILNKEKTELNFILGLCMGHDILFSIYSNAPVSTLIVKDRVTGNNPAAALYGWHRRRQLLNDV